MRVARCLSLVAAALVGPPCVHAATVIWTRIDVQARLDDDGRLHVVETHHLQLGEAGGFRLSPEFGLAQDQSLVLHGVTRLGADGSAQPLVETEGDVEGPESYAYYPRGHAVLRLPELPAGATLAYRFEYELVNAVSPAWGLGAGPGALAFADDFVSPLARLRQILHDWREAWPLGRRYRLDHDVLLPSREGPGYEVRRVDYQLEYGRAWRLVHPEAELAQVTPDDHYRVRPLLDYLPEGRPAAAPVREAALRLAALLGLPFAAVLLWLAWLGAAALRLLRAPPLDAAAIAEHFAELAPETVAPVFSLDAPAPTAEQVLGRLAGEGKIRIEVLKAPEADGDPDADADPDVRLTLLAERAALPAFERDVLHPFFPDGRGSSAARLRKTWGKEGLDPDRHVLGVWQQAGVERARPRRRIGLVTGLLLGSGVLLQVRGLRDPNLLPLLLIADFVIMLVAGAWPRDFWHPGRSWRSALIGLLFLPAGLAWLAAAGMQLATSRPLPVLTALGTALVALAAYATVLRCAPIRLTAEGRARLSELIRIRRFAAAELRGRRPRLDDRWIPVLTALGLGSAIERWRSRHGRAPAAPPGRSGSDGGEVRAAPFTGRARRPFDGPPGWAAALYVPSREEREAEGTGE